MTTIWKYTLEITDRQILHLPKWSVILCVQWQGNQPFLWAKVDPASEILVPRVILTYGTGHPIEDRNGPGSYISTYQTPQGLVFHVFDGGKA